MKNSKQSIFNIFLINLVVLGILVVVLAVIGELTLRHYIPSWDHSRIGEINIYSNHRTKWNQISRLSVKVLK